MHEKFQFFTGRTSFYRTSAVLFTGDDEGKKIKVGFPGKIRAHAYPHLLKSFFIIFAYFFDKKIIFFTKIYERLHVCKKSSTFAANCKLPYYG